MLWEAAIRLSKGAQIVEIANREGRSTVMLGAAAELVGARLTTIGPEAKLLALVDGLHRHPLEVVPERSRHVRPVWAKPVDLLYIDGKDQSWGVGEDLRWSALMPPDAEILVYDCFSSVGVTSNVLFKVLSSRRYTYVDRVGSLARLRLKAPRLAQRFEILRELPWFADNVLTKAGLKNDKWPGRPRRPDQSLLNDG
ncbi:MAG TPA: hypothetical protein DGG94_23075 [Micromonosporaceae bacterium]|nr:hypothetical protein [Micromonosporaceae bacterium]HCU52635.1 hypothetical protein [Micromonosporaceae bacterium]